MKKYALLSILLFPLFATANEFTTTMNTDESKQKQVLSKIKQNNINVCVYADKEYSEGAVLSLTGGNYRCTNKNFVVTEKEYRMYWERIGDIKNKVIR